MKRKHVEAVSRSPSMRLLVATALFVLAAGCATPDGGGSFRLSGSFTSDRTEADLADFQAVVRPYSDDVAIMESFPEQFAINGIVGRCEQLRATLEAKPYIANVGACTVEREAGDDGDEATSSP